MTMKQMQNLTIYEVEELTRQFIAEQPMVRTPMQLLEEKFDRREENEIQI